MRLDIGWHGTRLSNWIHELLLSAVLFSKHWLHHSHNCYCPLHTQITEVRPQYLLAADCHVFVVLQAALAIKWHDSAVDWHVDQSAPHDAILEDTSDDVMVMWHIGWCHGHVTHWMMSWSCDTQLWLPTAICKVRSCQHEPANNQPVVYLWLLHTQGHWVNYTSVLPNQILPHQSFMQFAIHTSTEMEPLYKGYSEIRTPL